MRLGLLLLLGLTRAEGEEPPGGWLAEARRAEREGRPEAEVEACRALLDGEGGGRGRAACTERLRWLEARRDEDGSFAGLAALEAARRGRGALEALVERPGTAPVVVAEARLALAREARRRGAAEEGLSWLAPVSAPPAELERAWRQEEAALRLALGQEAPSASEAQRRERRRERIGTVGAALAGAWGLLALPLAVRGWAGRPRALPLGLVPLLLTGLFGLGLVVAWEARLGPGVALGLGLLLLSHLLAAGGALALARRPRLRALFGAASALGTLGLALAIGHRQGLLPWVGL